MTRFSQKRSGLGVIIFGTRGVTSTPREGGLCCSNKAVLEAFHRIEGPEGGVSAE